MTRQTHGIWNKEQMPEREREGGREMLTGYYTRPFRYIQPDQKGVLVYYIIIWSTSLLHYHLNCLFDFHNIRG